MMSTRNLPRIAFVDLTFNWPPVGGCWVDLKEVIAGLSKRGFRTKLFVPVWTDYYPRGQITEDLPFPVEKIHFSRFTFNAYHLRKRFGRAVREWSPDLVFLGDGYHLKPHLLDHFSKVYPTWCRFYAYDVNCLNLHYWLYSENRICDGGFLSEPNRCHRCWHPGHSLAKRIVRIGLGLPDLHPNQHFSHEYLTSLAFTSWYRRHLPAWLGKADRLVVYNEFIAEFFRPFSDKVEVHPSGVDTKLFAPPAKPPKNSRPVIFVPGRVNDELKGFDTVKKACEHLREKGLDLEVRITAAYDMHFEEEWITNLGWVNQEALPPLYHSSDIVVVPSLWVEPFGITTLEAMACGLPVIGARIGGIAETLVDGRTGIHFTAGNEEELAEALEQFIQSPDLRQEYGKAGRRRAEEVYDWDVLVDKYYAEPFSRLAKPGS